MEDDTQPLDLTSLFDACGNDAEHTLVIAVLDAIRQHLASRDAPAEIDRASRSDVVLSLSKSVFVRLVTNRVLAQREIGIFQGQRIAIEPEHP